MSSNRFIADVDELREFIRLNLEHEAFLESVWKEHAR